MPKVIPASRIDAIIVTSQHFRKRPAWSAGRPNKHTLYARCVRHWQHRPTLHKCTGQRSRVWLLVWFRCLPLIIKHLRLRYANKLCGSWLSRLSDKTAASGILPDSIWTKSLNRTGRHGFVHCEDRPTPVRRTRGSVWQNTLSQVKKSRTEFTLARQRDNFFLISVSLKAKLFISKIFQPPPLMEMKWLLPKFSL